MEDGCEIATLDSQAPPITHFAFSPDGRVIAAWAEAGSDQGTGRNAIQLWDVQRRTQRASLPLDVRDVHLSFSHDGQFLVAAIYRSGAHIFDVATGQERRMLTDPVIYPTLSPDNSVVAAWDDYRHVIRITDTTSGELRREISAAFNVEAIEFSPDNRTLMTVTWPARRLIHIGLWDWATGESKGEYDGYNALFGADGRAWLGTGKDGVLRMRETATGKELAALKTDWTGALDLAGGGNLLVMGTRLLDLTTWTLFTIPGHYFGGFRQVLSRDGSTLTVRINGGVMIFGVPTSKRPAWQPIKAHITTSGITLRAGVEPQSKVIGAAKRDVLVGGRDDQNESLYLPELKGWVWGDYVDLGGVSIESLPVVCLDQSCNLLYSRF